MIPQSKKMDGIPRKWNGIWANETNKTECPPSSTPRKLFLSPVISLPVPVWGGGILCYALLEKFSVLLADQIGSVIVAARHFKGNSLGKTIIQGVWSLFYLYMSFLSLFNRLSTFQRFWNGEPHIEGGLCQKLSQVRGLDSGFALSLAKGGREKSGGP